MRQRKLLRREAMLRAAKRRVSTATNECDPFTLEKLGDIQSERLFFYTNARGCVFGFDAQNLLKACKRLGWWNPYNREPIPDADIGRLIDHVRSLPVEMDEPVVETRTSIILDTLAVFDELGFYTDPSWFDLINQYDVINIFGVFKVLTPSVSTQAFSYSNLTTAISTGVSDEIVICLAREMKEAVQSGGDMRFTIACRVLESIGRCVLELRSVFPSWVYSDPVFQVFGIDNNDNNDNIDNIDNNDNIYLINEID
jgi:hypothetical protein